MVTEASLAPSERLDVLFGAAQAQVAADIFLKSLAFDAAENEGMGGGMSGMTGMTGRGMG